MKSIRMLTDEVGGNGEALEAGKVYTLVDPSAEHWLKRKKAEEVSEETSAEDADAVGAPTKPSEGLTVAQIKDALAELQIVIPDGMTLKADLADLLDNAAD